MKAEDGIKLTNQDEICLAFGMKIRMSFKNVGLGT